MTADHHGAPFGPGSQAAPVTPAGSRPEGFDPSREAVAQALYKTTNRLVRLRLPNGWEPSPLNEDPMAREVHYAYADTVLAMFAPQYESRGNSIPSADDALNARLKAAGMYSIPEMMGVTPLTRWMVQVGMTDLDFFEAWLDRRVHEFLRMQAGYELGDKDKGDELFEWVHAHLAAFSEVRDNFRAVRAAMAAPGGEARRAETGTSSVHEHPVGEAEAPDLQSYSPAHPAPSLTTGEETA